MSNDHTDLDLTHHHHTDLEYWRDAASKVPGARNPLRLPYDIMLAEAVSAAAFVRNYWHPEGARPGLAGIASRLPEQTPNEVLSLVRAVQHAQTQLLLLVDPLVLDKGERARFVIDELETALRFLLDDDEDEPEDEQLAQIKAFHSQDGQRSSALAQSLRDYGALASNLQDRLVALDADFDVSLIAEASVLADALSELPLASAPSDAAVEAARTLRNQLLRLLTDRIRLIRHCVRYVFRRHPDIVRLVTSAYERRRRSAARRARERQQLAEQQKGAEHLRAGKMSAAPISG